MKNSLSLRFGDMPSIEWRDELRARIDAIGITGSVTLTPAGPPSGALGSVDPNIVTAIVTGGAQILAAVVTVLGGLWLAKRKVSDTQDTPTHVVIVVHGSEGSRTVHMDSSEFLSEELSGTEQGRAPSSPENETLLHALKGVGLVREVEVK